MVYANSIVRRAVADWRLERESSAAHGASPEFFRKPRELVSHKSSFSTSAFVASTDHSAILLSFAFRVRSWPQREI